MAKLMAKKIRIWAFETINWSGVGGQANRTFRKGRDGVRGGAQRRRRRVVRRAFVRGVRCDIRGLGGRQLQESIAPIYPLNGGWIHAFD